MKQLAGLSGTSPASVIRVLENFTVAWVAGSAGGEFEIGAAPGDVVERGAQCMWRAVLGVRPSSDLKVDNCPLRFSQPRKALDAGN